MFLNHKTISTAITTFARRLAHASAATLAAAALLSPTAEAHACTSLIASGSATLSGRPLLWKHRDTGASDNFLYRVENPGEIGYVGLFNGGDSLDLSEAWMGMNDAGFAIMNTVAYNLPENDPDWADREGIVMARALASCRTVDDFEALLEALPKPLGVRTNFGCIDAEGHGAYFETDDYRWTRYDVDDAPGGVLIRTNYSMSGAPDEGMGYIRYSNVEYLLKEAIPAHTLTPASLTEGVSRSFYNTMIGNDMIATGDDYIVDQDYVPRRSSTASIVVEGVLRGQNPAGLRMWTILGYPPVSPVYLARLNDIPTELLPISETNCHAPANVSALEAFRAVFPVRRGNGPQYIRTEALIPLMEAARALSLDAYSDIKR